MTANNVISWSASCPGSPTPEPDAVKLLEFLDAAAQSIKVVLEKSSKPSRKRLQRDSSSKYLRKTKESVTSESIYFKPEGGKRKKVIETRHAQDSLNLLFNPENLKTFTQENITRNKSSMAGSPDKSLMNRCLPLSFFVEPALRDINPPSTHWNRDSNSWITNPINAEIRKSADSKNENSLTRLEVSIDTLDGRDTCLRSPSLPEDTLESILDQGEINDLLARHRWQHDAGAQRSVSATPSDCSSADIGSWMLGADWSGTFTPSPKSCSESSCESFLTPSPAPPPVAFEHHPYHGSIAVKPTGRGQYPGAAQRPDKNFARLPRTQQPLFQTCVYGCGNPNEVSGSRRFRCRQTHCEMNSTTITPSASGINVFTSQYMPVRGASFPYPACHQWRQDCGTYPDLHISHWSSSHYRHRNQLVRQHVSVPMTLGHSLR